MSLFPIYFNSYKIKTNTVLINSNLLMSTSTKSIFFKKENAAWHFSSLFTLVEPPLRQEVPGMEKHVAQMPP